MSGQAGLRCQLEARCSGPPDLYLLCSDDGPGCLYITERQGQRHDRGEESHTKEKRSAGLACCVEDDARRSHAEDPKWNAVPVI